MDIFSMQFLWALGAIVLIDLVLAGDNAIVIALAARNLPKHLRKKAIVWGSVGLTGMSGPDQQAPQVAISFPADKASLDLAIFNLTGTASDNAGPVANVELSINGGAVATVPVAAGAFSIEVKLKPGTNTLKITAKDAAGNVASTTSTASFNAGVSGFLHVADDEAQRISGATVQLREKDTGTVVSTSTTDATGAFSLATSVVPMDHVLFVKAAGFLSYSETITIPDDQRRNYILQERIQFEPVIQTPEGPTQAEIRVMYVRTPSTSLSAGGDRYQAVLPLIRMGRGKMMGVDHNKGLRWVGASAGFVA